VDCDLPVGKTVTSACAKPLRAASYVSMSTADQHCELQLRDLRDQGARQRWEVVGVYEDVMSGQSAFRQIPGEFLLVASRSQQKAAGFAVSDSGYQICDHNGFACRRPIQAAWARRIFRTKADRPRPCLIDRRGW